MEITVKSFAELTTEELYELLKLRVNVFVVEQNCPYPELDDRDQKAMHVYADREGRIAGYLRVMDRDAEHPHVSIGRVLTTERRQGIGTALLQKGIAVARDVFQADSIYLEAQTYAKTLYEKQGFRQISDEFLEDGIPHVAMLLEL